MSSPPTNKRQIGNDEAANETLSTTINVETLIGSVEPKNGSVPHASGDAACTDAQAASIRDSDRK